MKKFIIIVLYILVALTLFDVINYYIFSAGSITIQELEWHLFDLIMLISISLTLENNRHVRVDIFYSKMSENHKRYIDIIAYLIFIIPLSILIIIKSTLFIINSFIQNEIFADPGGLAFRFLVKSLIVIGFSLLIIESIKKILNITK